MKLKKYKQLKNAYKQLTSDIQCQDHEIQGNIEELPKLKENRINDN